MLRVHCVQVFYNLSDPRVEDRRYNVKSARRFAGLKLTGRLPDEGAVLTFRHRLAAHGLGEAPFEKTCRHLEQPRRWLSPGTILGASIPSSTLIPGTRELPVPD